MRDFDHFLAGLWKSSWQISALIVAVLVAQWLFGRWLAPRWRHALWMLVVLRLIVPWSIPVSITPPSSLRIPDAPILIAANAGSEETADDSDSAQPVVHLPWLFIIWATGAVSFALYLTVTHWQRVRKLSSGRPLMYEPLLHLLEDCKETMRVRAPITLIETSEIGSPALFGVIRPRLLLPRGLAESFSHDELRFVFLHELAHVKRRDILIGWLAAVLQIAHWFNPLVWLAFHRLRTERELACDALALSRAGDGENQRYGAAILKLLEGFGKSAWAPSLAGALENINDLKERMTMIAHFKKTNAKPVFAIALVAVLGAATFTEAQPNAAMGGQPDVPHIVATSPAVGASDIDPATTEITVTFDQDMQGGMSWTGGGVQFPGVAEGRKPHWRDKRTCVLPVKLYQGHYYRVGINSESFQNFRSASGIPVEASAIYFTTKGASAALVKNLQTPQIVSMTPANGARDVDSSTTELRVTFNEPMGEGFSWTGSPPDMPDSPSGSKPHWSGDHKTCVLPVVLRPGTKYQLGINSEAFRNFQSAGGIPVDPVVYIFQTK